MANDSFEPTPSPMDIPVLGTQKILNILFIIDISGSMRASGRMDAVNQAMIKMIPALREAQISCQSEFELRIAIMTFDKEARWIVQPVPVMEYMHEEIDCSKWKTYYSKAFDCLNEVLTRKAFMAHQGKIAVPFIMFLTDGEPSEEDDYQSALDRLLGNAWFTNSQRFAVLMGEEAIKSDRAKAAVRCFVSDEKEGIINAQDAEDILADVQARTLQTIAKMTNHAPEPDPEGETGTGQGTDGTDLFPDDIPGDVPFPGDVPGDIPFPDPGQGSVPIGNIFF